jgi:TPR repeat protein
MKDTGPQTFTLALPEAPSTLTSMRARLGDAPSQAALGLLCTREGRHEEALVWFDQAAQNLPVASVLYYNAAILFDMQHPQYMPRAVSLLQVAAEKDCWEAQQTLASLHIHGDFVPKDLDIASRLLERSARLRALPPNNSLERTHEG